MEFPSQQRAYTFYILWLNVIAFPCISEYPFTNWHWAFYFRVYDFKILVESQIHDVKVIATTYVAYDWNSFYEHMGRSMSVTLDNAMDSTYW
jgi:hypothetical protein